MRTKSVNKNKTPLKGAQLQEAKDAFNLADTDGEGIMVHILQYIHTFSLSLSFYMAIWFIICCSCEYAIYIYICCYIFVYMSFFKS